MRPCLRPLCLLLVAFLLVTGAAVAEEPEYEQVEQTLYADWEGCGADAHLFLTTFQPSSSNGCGTIGGAPVNTVNVLTDNPTVRSFSAENGLPVLLDGSEPLTGEASVHSWTGVTGAGVGAVVVEATVRGVVDGQVLTLGVAEDTFVATPADSHVTLEFELDLANHDRQTLSGLTLDLVIWGAHVDSGIVATGGLTFVNVPTLVEVATD